MDGHYFQQRSPRLKINKVHPEAPRPIIRFQYIFIHTCWASSSVVAWGRIPCLLRSLMNWAGLDCGAWYVNVGRNTTQPISLLKLIVCRVWSSLSRGSWRWLTWWQDIFLRSKQALVRYRPFICCESTFLLNRWSWRSANVKFSTSQLLNFLLRWTATPSFLPGVAQMKSLCEERMASIAAPFPSLSQHWHWV